MVKKLAAHNRVFSKFLSLALSKVFVFILQINYLNMLGVHKLIAAVILAVPVVSLRADCWRHRKRAYDFIYGSVSLLKLDALWHLRRH
jgi:hypothetical protein